MEQHQHHDLQLRERSTGLIATLTDLDRCREFERSLTINKIITDAIPIVELKRTVGSRQVAIALDVQLTRLVASLNLKWNVSDTQIKTIVEDLIDTYPSETIEDFILCFRKARLGEYGELVRLDSPIVFTWMQKYLEEKYQVIEDKLTQEKAEFNKPIESENDKDWLKVWKDAIDSIVSKRVFEITDDEIHNEGKVRPKKAAPYPVTSPMEAYIKERHLAYIQQNYDARTAEKLPGWISEEDFNVKYDEEHL
jgi:hypothetical protein